MTGRFRRSDRLRVSRDYQRVAAQGDRFASEEFVLLVARAGPKATGRVRLGITASRRVGNAVVRNRVKRAVRDWFRSSGRIEAGSEGLDIVVIARRTAASLDTGAIADCLCALVDRRAKTLA